MFGDQVCRGCACLVEPRGWVEIALAVPRLHVGHNDQKLHCDHNTPGGNAEKGEERGELWCTIGEVGPVGRISSPLWRSR